ncbi:MAG: hypothetical protein IJ523_11465 [Succinivibrionaceae bacterium]|nr:hypothetical protein [Succinivibrionaceae bacterium]
MNIVATYPNIPALNLNVPTESAQHDAAARQVVPAASQAFTSSAHDNEVGSQREREKNNETRYHGHEAGSESDVEDVTYSSIIHSRHGGEHGEGESGRDDAETDPQTKEEKKEAKYQQNDVKLNGDRLTDEEQAKVEQMKARDREVQVHEKQHKATGGQYASQPSYTREKGPDGKDYIVDGEVSISVSEESTPEKTVAKMKQVYAAALAPAEPSGQDRKVAAEAKSIQHKAEAQIRKAKTEGEDPKEVAEAEGSGKGSNVSTSGNLDSGGSDVSRLMSRRNAAISNRYNSSWSPFRTSIQAFA